MNGYEDRIQELLEKMTIEEKVGQLQQCGPSLVGAFDVSFEELLNMMFDGRISEEEFGRLMSTATQDYHEEDLRAGKIGSYNGIKDAQTANQLQKIAVEETRLGIPLLFGYDVIHGYRTVTPIPLGEACAWDPKLWEQTARVAAKEATAAGVHMTFAPMVDVAKDARWGRVSEGAGEDALLSSAYGVSKVKGFQGEDLTKEDAMVACVKHFAAYGAGEGGRDYNRVDMSMQRFYEEYLPPFEACVKAGARAIMPAFNDLNGVPCTVNKWLLTDVLRQQWGFDGMTVSDANAIAECVDHGIAQDRAHAAKQALEAGVDMDMSSNCYVENIAELKEEALDRAVADVLRIKFELGLFEQPYKTSKEREEEELLKKEHRAVAREAAAKSMVLLKNEKVLPIKQEQKLGMVGELAAQSGEMLGAWAVGASGDDCVSILQALDQEKVKYEYAAELDQEAMKRLQECDVICLTAGEKKEESGEAASKADISMKALDLERFEQLKAMGKPVVVILFNGRPLAIPEIAERADAILEAWHPGVEAGNAILDVLYGSVNPSGKLTTTFPYTSGQCPMYYGHMNTGRPGGKAKFTSKYLDTPLTPVYPFGYGLSYTTYEYANLAVTQEEEGICAVVEVTNTGARAGEEIVQCYFRDRVGQRVRPVKQLADFEKIFLLPGESKKVEFCIPYSKFGYYDWNMKYVVEDGNYDIFVGKNSAECLEAGICIEGKA